MFDQRGCALLIQAATANGVTIPSAVLNMHVNQQAVHILELWGGTSRPGFSYNTRIVKALSDIAGSPVEGQVNDSIRSLLNIIAVSADTRAVTLDLAGSAGSLASGDTFSATVRNENLESIRTITMAATGQGSTTNSWAILTLASLFTDYDGSKDIISAVLTPTGSLTWDENGVGPRIMRFNAAYSASNDCQSFRSASTTDRLIGANITQASAGVYTNSGVYDALALSAIFSPGATVAGWSDDSVVQGDQISPALVQTARVSAYSANQSNAGLLGLSTTDPIALGMSSIVGSLTSTLSQSATGLQFDLGSSSMTVRYVHFFHSKGE